MTSQLVISELFYLFFSVPPTLDLKNNSHKSTYKKFWPNYVSFQYDVDGWS